MGASVKETKPISIVLLPKKYKVKQKLMEDM